MNGAPSLFFSVDSASMSWSRNSPVSCCCCGSDGETTSGRPVWFDTGRDSPQRVTNSRQLSTAKASGWTVGSSLHNKWHVKPSITLRPGACALPSEKGTHNCCKRFAKLGRSPEAVLSPTLCTIVSTSFGVWRRHCTAAFMKQYYARADLE
jgi:hypothetical protein